MAILKPKKKASVGEDVAMLQPSDTVEEDMKHHSCCGKQYGSSSGN